MGLSKREDKKTAEDALSEAEKNYFIPEESLINYGSDEE